MNTPQFQHVPTLGLVLAGGEARRMGGNKAFREVGGKSLIGRVIDVAQAQCDQVMISSNAGAEAFANYDLPVVADHPKPGQGPLGGILGGLKALPNGIDWLVTFPVDCPIVPLDMVARLRAAAEDAGAKAAFASHAERDHYLSSIWHRDAAPVIAGLLASDDRRVRGPLRELDAPRVVFEQGGEGYPIFSNVNTFSDLSALRRKFDHVDPAIVQELRDRLCEWQEHTSFAEASAEIARVLPARTLFRRPGLNFVTEAYVAARISSHLQAEKVRLFPESSHDFELFIDGELYRFEVTEADQPKRARGDEDWPEEATLFEIDEDNVHWEKQLGNAKSWLETAAANKLDKYYSLDTNLIIYLNMDSTLGYDDRITSSFYEATSIAHNAFRSIWVLWQDKPYKVTPLS